MTSQDKIKIVIRIGILTISDRSARGERLDESGPSLADAITRQGWQVIRRGIVPDDYDQIISVLTQWADGDEMDIILTTGGTGFSPRDVTPEATLAVIERLTPGIAEAMRSESLRITPHAMLSRSMAGIRHHTLIINLPGSPKAAVENLNVVMAVLPHAVQLLREEPSAEAGHRMI
jgi:molybdenum cofactor synthesis domain-containing protein